MPRRRRRRARDGRSPLRRVRGPFRRRARRSCRCGDRAPPDDHPRAGARLLHPNRVRVRLRRVAGGRERPAVDLVRRRALRRARRDARWAARAGHRVRHGSGARAARPCRRGRRPATGAGACGVRRGDRGGVERGRGRVPADAAGGRRRCRRRLRGAPAQGAAQDGGPQRRAATRPSSASTSSATARSRFGGSPTACRNRCRSRPPSPGSRRGRRGARERVPVPNGASHARVR